jgi:hypothetical protein
MQQLEKKQEYQILMKIPEDNGRKNPRSDRGKSINKKARR